MQFCNLLFYLMMATTLLLFSAPVAESTFLLIACIRKLPICPLGFSTTTIAPTTNSTEEAGIRNENNTNQNQNNENNENNEEQANQEQGAELQN